MLLQPGKRADALLTCENRFFQGHRVFCAEYFVLALEQTLQLGQQTRLLAQHLSQVLAADVRIQGGRVHDG